MEKKIDDTAINMTVTDEEVQYLEAFTKKTNQIILYDINNSLVKLQVH